MSNICSRLWNTPITLGGIPYVVAHCQACFDVQGNGDLLLSIYLSSNNHEPSILTMRRELNSVDSIALQIKTSLTMGNSIGYPTV